MKRRKVWRRWVGSQVDLADAIDTAIALVDAEASPVPRRHIEIVVPPYTFEDESSRELRNLSSRDLSHLRSLNARITSDILQTDVVIRADREDAVTLEVSGSRKTTVDGLTDQVARVLDRGKPTIPWMDRRLSQAAGVALGIAIAALAFTLGPKEPYVENGMRGYGTPTWVAVPSLLFILVLPVLATVVVPNLEILTPGGKSRMRRARRLAVAAISLAAAAVGLLLALHDQVR